MLYPKSLVNCQFNPLNLNWHFFLMEILLALQYCHFNYSKQKKIQIIFYFINVKWTKWLKWKWVLGYLICSNLNVFYFSHTRKKFYSILNLYVYVYKIYYWDLNFDIYPPHLINIYTHIKVNIALSSAGQKSKRQMKSQRIQKSIFFYWYSFNFFNS